MPIANQALLDAANATFLAKFDEIYTDKPPGVWDLYTEVIPTDSKSNTIDVLETMPVVREWVGMKEFQSILASALTVAVTKWEKSFYIDRLDLVADRMGMIGRRISKFLSSDVRAYFERPAFLALVSNSGNGPTVYDGLSLFSTSHVRSNGTTWSNKSTTALSFAQHDAIMTAGASMVDNNGEPIGIAYDTLVVGPKLRKLAMEITQSTERFVALNASGAEAVASVVAATSIPNVYGGGQMTLIVDPRLVGTYDDYYYYLDTTRGPKPLIMFELEAPHPEVQDRMDNDDRFKLDRFNYSVEAYMGIGGGSPHVAYAGIL